MDGKRLFRVTHPHTHGKDVPAGTLNSIRNQCRLSHSDFKRLIDCSMNRNEYRAVIEAKWMNGLLGEDAPPYAGSEARKS